MPTNTMSIHGPGNGEDPEDVAAMQGAASVHFSSNGTDELLDEIDGLLESNAEEFVRSYVQKGGQ